jgi:hypothetical protein
MHLLVPAKPIVPDVATMLAWLQTAQAAGFTAKKPEWIVQSYVDGPAHAEPMWASSGAPLMRKLYSGNARQGFEGSAERWWVAKGPGEVPGLIEGAGEVDVSLVWTRKPARGALPGLEPGPDPSAALRCRRRSREIVMSGASFGRVATKGKKLPAKPTYRSFAERPVRFAGTGLVKSRFWIQIDPGVEWTPGAAALAEHGVHLADPVLVSLAESTFGVPFGQGWSWE